MYPRTNELFVADGYGNKRIIVLDADTGRYKRMWGAFRNVPLDDTLPGAAAADDGGANRTLAMEFDPNDPGPAQFNTVHGIKVSNDGLVYFADRGGERRVLGRPGSALLVCGEPEPGTDLGARSRNARAPRLLR